MRFDDLKLAPSLLEAISYMGFEKATPIQELAIPQIIAGKDLIACAQTGTGKTAAFLLPILNNILKDRLGKINTLVLVPTRELAIQIDQEIQGIAYSTTIGSLAVYGGDNDGLSWVTQKKALTEGADIIVATPGKLISHINMGYVDFSDLKHLVLDEADRMLDIGFYDDIMKIIAALPKKRQTLMFSATMPSRIKSMAKMILSDPAEVSISMSKPAEGVLQAAYLVYDNQKIPLINKLINDKPDYKSILIFGSTKKKVSEIARTLKGKGYPVEKISSDLEQSEREDVLLRFKSRKIRVLVATDVLSRGIDVKDINLVINFDVPGDAEDYVHRVGRTARAETSGVALTFVNPDDMLKFKRIESLIEREVPKILLPEGFDKGPEWMEHGSEKPHRKFSGKGKPFRKKGANMSNKRNENKSNKH